MTTKNEMEQFNKEFLELLKRYNMSLQVRHTIYAVPNTPANNSKVDGN